jgi:hypothetical protein
VSSKENLIYAMFCFVSLYARTSFDLQEKMTEAFVANGARSDRTSPQR